MADGASLGKATLDIEANLGPFIKNMQAGRGEAGQMQQSLDSLSAIAEISAKALAQVKLTSSQALESDRSAEGILAGVSGISDEARNAARELDNVKLSQAQAAESKAAADEISEGLDQVGRNADQASRKLDKVKISQSLGSKQIGGTSVSLLGAAVGIGAVLAPAAGPALLGLLAALPAALATVGGVAGVAALAFSGLSSAIGGNKKAYDLLNPTQQQFVTTVRSMSGELANLKQIASTDLLPGLTSALHDALSPGTLGAVTTAVGSLATALGHAGQEWGQYFGSAQFQNSFGPLMQDAASNVTLLSNAALHLFNAIGTLGVAGIPLTSWMVTAIDRGAQLADTWLKGQQASGGLAGAMNEAQVSLRLVAQLVEAAGKAVGALGVALYPVSKVAVKDLTDGLNGLAKIIDKNQAGIQSFVQGAVDGLSAAVKTAVPIIVLLAHELGAVVANVGGWKTAFEIIIAGVLISKIIDLYKSVETLATKFGLVAPAAKKAAIDTEASVAGIGDAAVVAESRVLGLRASLLSMVGMVIPVAIAESLIPPSGKGQTVLDKAGLSNLGHLPIVGGLETQAAKYGGTALAMAGMLGPSIYDMVTGKGGNGKKTDTSTSPASGSGAGGLSALGDLASNALSGASSAAATAQALQAGGAFGSSPAFTKGLGGGGKAAANAANALAAALAGDHSKLTTLGKQIATDATSGLIPDSLISGLQERSTRLALAISTGTKKSLPSISSGLTDLKSAVQEGLKQAVDDKKVVTLGKQLQDDIDNKLITPEQFTNLGMKLGKLNETLTTTLLSPEARKQVEANINTLKAQLKLDLTLTGEQKQLELSVGQLNEVVTAKLFPASVTASAKKDAKAVGDDIAEGTTAGSVAAKGALKDLAAALKAGIADIAKGASIGGGLVGKETALTAGFNGLSDIAAVLTGTGLDTVRGAIQVNLTAQETNLKAQVAVLKGQLSMTTGPLKAAVQTELTKVKGQLTSVQSQIIQSLQANVQTMQQKVSTLLSAVTSQFDTAFDAQTQNLLNQAAVTYSQNGAKTPLEAELASDQAADTVTSLNSTLTQAQQQLAADQQSNTQAISDASDAYNKAVSDQAANASTDPATIEQFAQAVTNAKAALNAVSNPATTTAQIALDQQAITQAQRAIDENTLSIKATQQRATADADYAAAVLKIQTDRAKSETDMNNQLAALSDAFANGTGSMSDLNTIASAFGITIGSDTIPSFSNLSTATGDLQTAFSNLGAYVDKITGTTAAPGAVPTGWHLAPGYQVTYVNGSPFVSAIPGYFNALDSLTSAVTGGAYGPNGPVQLHAAGGIMTTSTWLGPHDVGGEAGPEALIPLSDPRAVGMFAKAAGGGGDIHFHGGTFIGGNKQQVARDLQPYIDRIKPL